MIEPSYDLRKCSISDLESLIREYHGYKSTGRFATYAFGVYEDDRIVAGYTWNPPAPGSAKSVCPEAPHAVLALTRMVAVPRDQRQLRHVSTPLRRQMRVLVDRIRWPVLVTYSEEIFVDGEWRGHTGHVYKCSGWVRGLARITAAYRLDGERISSYSCGKASGVKTETGVVKEKVRITRWTHQTTESSQILPMQWEAGWRLEKVRGTWASGNQKRKWVKHG